VLDKFWLEKITAPFNESNINAVMGGFDFLTHTLFHKCVAVLSARRNPKHNKPSSRSFAFKKWIWEKIAKYPEWLKIHEDTHYDIELKNAGIEFYHCGDAKVHWKPRDNFKNLSKQFFRYAYWTGKSDDPLSHFHITIFFIYFLIACFIGSSIMIGYFGIISAMLLFMVYLIFGRICRGGKWNYLRSINIHGLLYSIPILLSIDLSMIIGFTLGKLTKPACRANANPDRPPS